MRSFRSGSGEIERVGVEFGAERPRFTIKFLISKELLAVLQRSNIQRFTFKCVHSDLNDLN